MNIFAPLVTFGSADEEAAPSFFESLGIDWKLLLIQAVAFLILVWALKKWVYPVFLRIVDEREQKIEQATQAADDAKAQAASAEAEIADALKQARDEAADIVTTARDEATAAIAAAETKAKAKAESIVAAAHDDIEKDIAAARESLRNETIDLVAAATEKVVGKTVSKSVDDTMIASAVSEAK